MNYTEKMSAYLAEEQSRFEALVAAEKQATENEVDKFIASNAVLEQMGWRANLIDCIAAKLPKDVATRALRGGFSQEHLQTNATYMLKEDFVYQKASPSQMRAHFQNILASFASYADEQTLEEALEEAKTYLPPRLRSTVVYPMQGKVDQMKESVRSSDRSAEEKENLSALLDRANEIMKDGAFAELQPKTNYSLGISRAIYRESSKILMDAVKNHEDQGALQIQSQSVLAKPLAGEPEIVEKIKDARIVLSETDKAHYLKVLKTMQEKGLLRPDVPAAGEESRKEFAFRNMMDAKRAMYNALTAGDFDAMKTAADEYDRQVDVMREIYRVAAEELGDDIHGFPDNVDNQRNEQVPDEFKVNCKLNAAVNGLYLTLQLIRETGATVEEMLEDPAKVSLDYMRRLSEEHSFEAFAKGRTLGQMLAYAANLDPKSIGSSYPFPLAVRPLEALNVLSQDPSVRRQNLLAEHMVEALVVEYEMDSHRAHTALTEELDKSVENMFLMGEDGMREPGAMSKEGYYDNHTFAHVPGVRTEEYLATHPQDPATLKAYIEKTMLEFSGELKKENPKMMRTLLDGVRGAIHNALIYGNIDLKTPEAKALISLYRDPKKELIAAGVAPEKMNLDYPAKSEASIIKDSKSITSKTKARLSSDKKVLRAEEKYNKKASKLEQRIADVESKLAGAGDEKTRAKLVRTGEALEQKLKALKDKEIKRLDTQRAAGKLTDVYHQRRTNDVKENQYLNKRDLYNDVARVDKGDFIAEQMQKGASGEEAVQKYARIEAQNALEARNVVARVRYGKEERKFDLSKADQPQMRDEGAPKGKEAPDERSRESEQPQKVVKQLDLSDKIRKPAEVEVKRERQPDPIERAVQKEQDEQIR